MKKNWIYSILSLFVLAGILVGFWIGGLILEGSTSDSISAREEIDYVIVLGCGLKEDKPERILQTRIATAVDFLKKYPDAVAICTGGKGTDELISEAEAIEKALLKAGISQKRILKETTSINTYENFKNAQELIKKPKEKKDPRVAIVTSEFHLYRSYQMAELNGFQAPIKVAASTPTHLFYPHFFREIAAVAVMDFRY